MSNDDVKINIVTPQFEREPGYPAPKRPPADRAGFEALAHLTKVELLAYGMRAWGREEDEFGKEKDGAPMLWLFPGEWYAAIPEGLPIVGIDFERETFQRGKSDDDIRFGMLPYGILVLTTSN